MLLLLSSDRIKKDPMDALWHYAKGELPWNVEPDSDEVRWMAASHRGVQFTDKIVIPKSQKRYILTDKFEFRFDNAFDECVHHCATRPRKSGKPWIGDDLRAAYSELHKMGFAHSYEAWQDGKLAAGAFGIHIGSYITCESMFHLVKNSGTFCWGQAALKLKDRGFTWIDTNCVATHRNHCGEEWVPHWKFEQMLREAITKKITVADDIPHPDLPRLIRLSLPARRVLRAVAKRAGLLHEKAPAHRAEAMEPAANPQTPASAPADPPVETSHLPVGMSRPVANASAN